MLGTPGQTHQIGYAERYRRDVHQILLISKTNNWTRAFGTSIANSTALELNIAVSQKHLRRKFCSLRDCGLHCARENTERKEFDAGETYIKRDPYLDSSSDFRMNK
jgi:hypothetical protein